MDSASPSVEQLNSKRPNEVVSLAPLRDFFYVMRGWISWGGIAIVLLGLVIIAAIWHGAPKVRYGQIKIALEFPGAQEGKYPNNLSFSPEDILSADIMKQVYDKYRVSDFISFKEFQEGITIRQDGNAVQKLVSSFRSQAEDPKLLGTERQQLNEEYNINRSNINSVDYTLIWVQQDQIIPTDLQAKVLEGMLQIWAHDSIEKKKALTFAVPLPNPRENLNIENAGTNPFGAYDLLAQRLGSIINAFGYMQKLPGANQAVLPNGLGLIDLQMQARSFKEQDMEAFQNRLIFSHGSVVEDALIQNALVYQVTSRQGEVRKAERQLEVLTKTFEDYLNGRKGPKFANQGPRDKLEGETTTRRAVADEGRTQEFPLLTRLEEATGIPQETYFRKHFVEMITLARQELEINKANLEETRQNVFLIQKLKEPVGQNSMTGKAYSFGEPDIRTSTVLTQLSNVDLNEFANISSQLNEIISFASNLVDLISRNYFGDRVIFYSVVQPFTEVAEIGDKQRGLVSGFVAICILGFVVLVGCSWMYYRHKTSHKYLRKEM
jgi:hypothetical protein